MRIISRKALLDFGKKHADAAGPLLDWERIVKRKSYTEHLAVKADFPSASFIGPRKVVFNICGNQFRLVVDVRYDFGCIYIRHVVTHKEYDLLISRGLERAGQWQR